MRSLLNLVRSASPGCWRERRLVVLTYHRVLSQPDVMRPGEMHAAIFSRHADVLAQHFNVLPLARALELASTDNLPRLAVSLTFDDGYADNLTVAAPVLRAHGLPATVFVATDFTDGQIMWHDAVLEALRTTQVPVLDLRERNLGVFDVSEPARRLRAARTIIERWKYLPFAERADAVRALVDHSESALPHDLMLTSTQLRALVDSGLDVGAHTCRHPILASLPDYDARVEIVGSKRILEERIGRPVHYFAYPNGRPRKDYTAVHVQMVKDAGFDAALSTALGAFGTNDDRFQIPRMGPWSESPVRFAARLLCTYGSRQPSLVPC